MANRLVPVVFYSSRLQYGACYTQEHFMPSAKEKLVLGDFPPQIGQPATRALAAAGYSGLEQLTRVTEKDLLALHGMGPRAIAILREALAAKGLSFAGQS
jgi:hypothetical protein